MKTKNVFASLSVGALMLVVGAFMTSIALSEAILTLFPDLSRAIAYMLVGGISLLVGGLTLDFGTDKAQDKVEKIEDKIEDNFTVEKHVQNHPLLALGASVVSGMVMAQVTQWLISSTSTPSTPSKTNSGSLGSSSSHESPKKSRDKTDDVDHDEKSEPTFLESIGEELESLGKMAGSTVMGMALQMGSKTLGNQVAQFFGDSNKSQDYTAKRSAKHTTNGHESAVA